MANTKDVTVVAWIPYDWCQELTDEEARIWLAWTTSPSSGLRIEYGGTRGVKLDNGGTLTMYHAQLVGREAISDKALVLMVDSWRRQRHAEIVEAVSRDLDYDPSDRNWYTIRTPEQQEEAEKRSKEHVEKMMEGKKWVTTKVADGVTEAHLEDDPDFVPDMYDPNRADGEPNPE